MPGLVHTVFAYQSLVARSERLRIPLDGEEHRRCAELARALGTGQGKGTRRMPRVLSPWPVMLTLPGGFAEARLRDMSGGGVRVITGSAPPEGTPVLVHIRGPLHGEEFVFPARVAWRRVGEDEATMGLAFDGVPQHQRPSRAEAARPRLRTPLVA